MEEKPEVTIKVSGLAQRIIIYGFALLVGGATILDLATPYGRSDPFTGTEAQELDDRLTYVELIVEQLQEDFDWCKKRMDKHLESATGKILQYEKALDKHSLQIDECLKRTGVKP